MAIAAYSLFISFLIGMIVSSVVIFIATKLFGEQEGFGTAILAAFIGAVIYAVAYFFLGSGIIAGVIGGVAWLIALGSLYKMGWLKSLLVAVVIWVIAAVVSYVLPTMVGPL
jgi:hypothetical protein